MELDARLLFGSAHPPDLDTVVMHELGHVIGLAHASRRGALMSRSVISSGQGAYLSADDRSAVCALYPVGVFDGVGELDDEDTDSSPGFVWLGALGLAVLTGFGIRWRLRQS